MRILRLFFALILVGSFVQEIHAAAATNAPVKRKRKASKVITRVDTLKKTDTLLRTDTLLMQDQRRLDSLSEALGTCRAVSVVVDSELAAERNAGLVLQKSLDSLRTAARDLSIQLARQTDSMRTLDSLRKALAPDSTQVLFLPVSYDTVRHPGDSTLARSLTRLLFAAALIPGQFSLYTPKGNDQRCNLPECWSAIARRRGAGQILTGTLSYSGDTLVYSSWMTSIVVGQVTRQSQVVGYRKESDPSGRFGRMAASQLFGIKDESLEDRRVDSPLWRRLLLLGVFGIFAGTVTALSANR
jgi:hypothetical protein